MYEHFDIPELGEPEFLEDRSVIHAVARTLRARCGGLTAAVMGQDRAAGFLQEYCLKCRWQPRGCAVLAAAIDEDRNHNIEPWEWRKGCPGYVSKMEEPHCTAFTWAPSHADTAARVLNEISGITA